MIDVQLLDRPLKPQECIERVADPGAGGTTAFVGTVRNNTKGRPVLRLEFEAYRPMAVSEMRKIAEAVTVRWEASGVAIHHRVGRLEIGEIAVVIAVATPHRRAAFEACQYAIDTLKETVPIWKKEIFEDGEVWVAAHP
ncbi:MAG: molybdenum cofactor biosynthesis protein MoaE [Saprospiraceae bacterium]|nr:molybdenum cofactor biosynthesis protein MoaE [Saprospiraceae bacterium]